MGSFSHYEACPKCRDRGKDSRGDNLGVWMNGSKFCFACSYHVGPPIGEIWKDQEPPPDKVNKILPVDFVRHVPLRALKWLMQFQLPYSHWKDYIGWSEQDSRLIFTVGHPSTLFSIGRYIGEDETKKKWYTYGEPHKHAVPFGRGPEIVVVEDLISAHKVGEVTEALPLFGTHVYPDHLYYLKQSGKPIILWLDKDQEDVIHKKASNLNMLTGLPVQYVVTEKDPKNVEIKGIRYAVSSCY